MKIYQKTGEVKLINNVISKGNFETIVPFISPDGNLLIFYTAPSYHDLQAGTNYIYFLLIILIKL